MMILNCMFIYTYVLISNAILFNSANSQYVLQYNYLYSSSCSGNLVNIVGYVDTCYEIGGGSAQYVCVDGNPTLNLYDSSTTCTGTYTTVITQSTSCSTTYDSSFNEWISTIWTCSSSLPANTVIQGLYLDSECTSLYKFTASTLNQCGYNPNYFYSNMVTCANGVESFSTYSDATCSTVTSTTNTNVPTACEIVSGQTSYQKTFCNTGTTNDIIGSTNGISSSNNDMQQSGSLIDSNKSTHAGIIAAVVLIVLSAMIALVWYYYYNRAHQHKHQLLVYTDTDNTDSTLTHQLMP